MDIVNIVLALFSIALGVFGWLAPRYTLETLDLVSGPTTMGTSEIRASAGALFVGLGLGALLLNVPAAHAMVGMAWAGAATGRATSLVLDGRNRKKWTFFVVEAAVAATSLTIYAMSVN